MHSVLKERSIFIENLTTKVPSSIIKIIYLFLQLLLWFSYFLNDMRLTFSLYLVVLLAWKIPFIVSILIALKELNLGHIFLLGLLELPFLKILDST